MWKPTHRWLGLEDETPGKTVAVADRRPGRRGRDRGAGRPSAFVVFVVRCWRPSFFFISCYRVCYRNRVQIIYV